MMFIYNEPASVMSLPLPLKQALFEQLLAEAGRWELAAIKPDCLL